MPNNIFGCNLRPDSVTLSRTNLKPSNAIRSGDILDSLVVMIVGLLLPAWLLGHLFLTIYPAPDTASETAAGNSDTAAVSGSDIEPNETELASSSNPDDPDAAGAGTKPNNESKLQLDSMTEKFQSLTTTSETLESEVMSLKQNNTTLAEENAALKTQMAQASSMAQNTPEPDNSAAMNELQMKVDSAALQLESTKQNLADATSRLESTENEKQTLQNDLANTQAKLEQANTDLAAAVAKSDASMEIKSEDESSGTPFALLHADKPKPDLAAEANVKVGELEQQVKELSLNLTNANDSMATQKEQIKELSLNLTNANDAMAAQKEQINELSLNLTSANDSMAAQKEQLQSAQNQMQTLVDQNGDLKTALSAVRDSAARDSTTQAQPKPPKEVFRDYVSSKGSISKMAFIRWEGEAVIVRSFANKKLYRLTMDRFSEADKKYLLDQK